jgi:glycosyltransferase involved in cell wall biosynthesis
MQESGLAEARQTKSSDTSTHRVLDIWAHVDPRFGGVGPCAASLAQAVQAVPRWESHLLAVCVPSEQERHGDIPESVQKVTERGFRPVSDFLLANPIRSAIQRADVCHIHGIWLPHSLAASRIARQQGKPTVFSAQGMLEPWDLANKRLKKQIYSFLFERRSLAQSACLRALHEQEAADYRKYGLKNPIAIVPNGVAQISRVKPTELIQNFPQLIGKRVVLFLGRIHRKKGVFDLVRAWPDVMRRHPDAHLLIAGGEYENAGVVARQIISDLRIENHVTFCGVLNGADKLQALSVATAFCLPSYSEGMSIAVLEALSIGLPVVITRACNVDGVPEAGAGYITPPEGRAIARSLDDCLSLTGAQWQSMSQSAKLLAQSKFAWSQSGESIRAVYEWLLGGAQPAFILR